MHKYVECSSNQKNLEATFAKCESRREVLKFHICLLSTIQAQKSTDQVTNYMVEYFSIINTLVKTLL